MIINTNIASLNAQRNLSMSNNSVQKSLEKLSSGYRINRAADDAAGLAISEKMRAQIKGLNQAVRNAQSGISLIQTAEGALNETHSILQRLRELAVQAATDTNASGKTVGQGDRDKIQLEVKALVEEVTRISKDTQFNGLVLLSGNYASTALTFHIGANADQNIKLNIADMSAKALSLSGAGGVMSMSGQGTANSAITTLDTAISLVSDQRAKLGAVQNRLEHTIANLNVAAENLSSSESLIRDVDMAKEMSNFTKSQILSQAGVAMLAQANQAPQGILKLLG